MSFRRIPFQFSSTDPAERQRELERRFGVPTSDKMYIDAVNPLTARTGVNTRASSPRFQHRVPLFVDGMTAQSSVDSSACENKTPKVRVIPIEVEKDESFPSSRHRTLSGPVKITKQQNKDCQREDGSTLKRSMEDLSKPSKMKAASGPKIYNIPIKVEQASAKKLETKSEKGKIPTMQSHPKVNGCDVSKHVQNVELKASSQETNQNEEKIKINNSLKKIDSVLEELRSYDSGVKDFNGTAKDKQYRYLDEMLTRCMIKLDDVETMGNEEVRSARKKVVKMVQACIDLLESKLNITDSNSVNTNVTKIESIEKEAKAEPSTVLIKDNVTEMNEKCIMVDTPEENQLTKNNENKLLQTESLISDVPSSEYKTDVPEVEMVEVTSTSSEMNLNDKISIDNLVNDHLQSDASNTISDVELTQPSEYGEIDMTDTVTQMSKTPVPDVSSTNILHPQKIVDLAQITDLNEAEMTVSSTLNNSSENQRVEAIPEVSSSIMELEAFAPNIEQCPTEAGILENSELKKNVKTEEADKSNNSNLQSTIPEIEMQMVENPCKTVLDKQQNNLQS